MYIIDDVKSETCCLSQLDESCLWHRRLGHMTFDSLIQISRKEVDRDMPQLTKPFDTVFKECQLGKQTWRSFKSKEYSSMKPLELIHTDLCGPTRTASMHGERYFMLLIDDYSRMTWLLLRNQRL